MNVRKQKARLTKHFDCEHTQRHEQQTMCVRRWCKKKRLFDYWHYNHFFPSLFRFAAMDKVMSLGEMPWAVDVPDFPNPNSNPMISYLRTRMIWCYPAASRAHLTDTGKLNDTDSLNLMNCIACSHFSIDLGSHLFILIAQFLIFGWKSQKRGILFITWLESGQQCAPRNQILSDGKQQ